MATLIHDNIIPMVAEVYGVTVEDILGKTRKQPIAEARQMAMYIYRSHAQFKFDAIANIFGRKHPTVISGVQSALALIDVDNTTKQKYNQILVKLCPNLN
jgi:chromosomal replication initiator protein